MRPTQRIVQFNCFLDGSTISSAGVTVESITVNGASVSYTKSAYSIILDNTLFGLAPYHETFFIGITGYYSGKLFSRSFLVWAKDTAIDLEFSDTGYNRVGIDYSPYNQTARVYDGRVFNFPRVWSNGEEGGMIEVPTSSQSSISIANSFGGVNFTYIDHCVYLPQISTFVDYPIIDSVTALMDSPNTGRLAMDLSAIRSFELNGTPQVCIANMVISGNIVDINDNIIESSGPQTFLVETTSFVWDPEDLKLNFNLPAGAYKIVYDIKLYLEGSSGAYYQMIADKLYKIVHYIQLESNEEGNLVLTNHGADTATVELYKIVGSKSNITTELEETVSMTSGSTVTLNNQGVYLIQSDNGTTEQAFIWMNLQKLQECIEALIFASVCNNDTEKFNELMPLFYYYMTLLHNEYTNNYVYELAQITQSKLSFMWEVQDLQDRIMKHCDDCVKQDNDCGCN